MDRSAHGRGKALNPQASATDRSRLVPSPRRIPARPAPSPGRSGATATTGSSLASSLCRGARGHGAMGVLDLARATILPKIPRADLGSGGGLGSRLDGRRLRDGMGRSRFVVERVGSHGEKASGSGGVFGWIHGRPGDRGTGGFLGHPPRMDSQGQGRAPRARRQPNQSVDNTPTPRNRRSIQERRPPPSGPGPHTRPKAPRQAINKATPEETPSMGRPRIPDRAQAALSSPKSSDNWTRKRSLSANSRRFRVSSAFMG